MRSASPRIVVTLALLFCATRLPAQERGAARLHELVQGLTTSARVLMVGAFPGDEDASLIAWLSRGRHVETGYLSLTRGEAGQNAIGTESGEALGALRTEELLAARRIDGARQFFTRAHDFGAPRDAAAAFERWPKDELLADVVSVIRAFRPHVLVSLHAQRRRYEGGVRQAADQLTREAFAAAADTVRFPAATYGAAWAPRRLESGETATGANELEYNPILGVTYSEIAAEAAAFHRTQTPAAGRVRPFSFRRATTLAGARSDVTSPHTEPSIFDDVDTTFVRLSVGAPDAVAGSLQLAAAWADSARARLDLQRPWLAVSPLARVLTLLTDARAATSPCRHPSVDMPVPRLQDFVQKTSCDARTLDLDASLDVARRRTVEALRLAAGVHIEATAPRELLAYGDVMPVAVRIANRGKQPVTIRGVHFAGAYRPTAEAIVIQPDSMKSWMQFVSGLTDTHPHWLGRRLQDLFPPAESPIDGLARVGAAGGVSTLPSVAIPEDYRRNSDISVTMTIDGITFTTSVGPVLHRTADPHLGVQLRPVGGVPAVTLSFGRGLEWIPAGKPVDRVLGLTIQSFSDSVRTFSFKSVVPGGLRLDSLPASVTLQPRERRELMLRLRGRIAAGRYEFGVVGTYGTGATFSEGFREITYSHIRPIRTYRQSGLWLQAVDIDVPRIVAAYVRGAGDGIPMWLTQLGASVHEIDASQLPVLDLSRYSTIMIGARAHETNPELRAYDPRLIDFVREGGTLVLLHAEVPATLNALLPWPLGWDVLPERVTDPSAPVTVREPGHALLTWPNRIGAADWNNWVQERALSMPSLIDPRYTMPLEVHDPGQKENRGAILSARVGKGTFVFTTLSFSRQLAAGVPGAARLLVNLLSAGQAATSASAPLVK